ncbi:MAG: hypothetical protein LBM74_01010 [Oscillospiraceae bacterium]|jgi:hypothetical protein|nr:hypothetical protein [Oscillospiraceae bacterium]
MQIAKHNTVIQKVSERLTAAWDHCLRRPWLALSIVYLVSVCVRIWLVFAAGELPFIFRDETRYFDMAQSLTGGEVLLRGQPVVYKYILYPLLLSPLFWLPEGVNVFRAMQVANALMMHAMVFPLFALCRRITGKQNLSFGLAVLSLLLPDTVMVKNIMTESLSYPMIALTLLFAHRMMADPEKTVHTVITAVLCFLLYTIKPGYASVSAACLAVRLAMAIRRRDKKALFQPTLFAAVILLALGVYAVILTALGVSPMGTTLYDAQASPFSLDHLIITLKGLLLYAHYHLIAFFILPPVLLLASWRDRDDTQKAFSMVVMLSIALTCIGTVYLIFMDEALNYPGDPLRIHVRYTAPFFLPMLALLPRGEVPKNRLVPIGVACLAFLGVGLAFYDPGAMESTRIYAVDSMMMALLKLERGAWNGFELYFPVLLGVLVPLSCLVLHGGFTARMRRVTISLIVAGLALNQYAAYLENSNNHSNQYSAEAANTLQMAGENAWMICEDGQEDWALSAAMDVHARAQMPIIPLSALLRATDANGVAVAVMPDAQKDSANPASPALFTLGTHMIFDADILNRIALASAEVTYSPNHLYAYMPVSADAPWVHSLLNGLNDGWVQEGSYFALYDPTLRANGTVRLYLSARAGQGTATLVLSTADGQSQSFTLGDTLQWIEADFAVDSTSAEPLTIGLSALGGNVYVDTYLVE